MDKLCETCWGCCCKTMIIAPVCQNEMDFLVDTRGVKIPGGVLIPCRCRYLGDDSRCTVYNHRPKVCKDYAPGGPACIATRQAFHAILGQADQPAVAGITPSPSER